MFRLFLLLTTLFYAISPLRAVDPQKAVDRFVADPAFRYGAVAVGLYEVATGTPLARYNTRQALMPASTAKLLPTAAALELLGADYCYTTRLCHDGTVDGDGTLQGNLYIVGNGDPTLGSSSIDVSPDSFLVSWISQLKQQGISRINGGVVAVDIDRNTTSPISGEWLWEDVANYYGAGSYGLNVYDNSYRVVIRSEQGGVVREITTEPSIPELTLTNRLQGWNNPEDSIVIYPDFGRSGVVVEGTLSRKAGVRSAKGTIPNPPEFLANLLSQALQQAGVEVKQSSAILTRWNSATGEGGLQLKPLVEWKSPPLKEICKQTNFRSLNVYAQSLLQTVGRACSAEGSVSAPQSLLHFWKEKGVETEGAWLYDGSGLAPTNRIHAELLAGVLNYMARKGHEREAFIASLPVAGREGTVAGLFREGASSGWVRVKSGSMNQVLCYAGYLTRGQKQYSLVIMINQYMGRRSELIPKIDTLLRALVKE